MNSDRKGKVGERELANELKRYGYQARRGQQFSGIEGEDVVGLPGIHIECKRVELININKAMDQAVEDAKPGDMPAVFSRKNSKPWLVTMRLEDWIKLYGRDRT